MSIKHLRRCPFCNGVPIIKAPNLEGDYYVACSFCGAIMRGQSEEEVRENWNSRFVGQSLYKPAAYDEIYELVSPFIIEGSSITFHYLYSKIRMKTKYQYGTVSNIFRDIMKSMEEEGRAKKEKGTFNWIIEKTKTVPA